MNLLYFSYASMMLCISLLREQNKEGVNTYERTLLYSIYNLAEFRNDIVIKF